VFVGREVGVYFFPNNNEVENPVAESALLMDELENPREDKLPNAGKAVLWMLLFIALYFASAILYFMGYGVVMAIQHSDLLGSPEFQSVVKESARHHANSATGLSGVYLVQFFVLFPFIILASSFKSQSFRETLGFYKFSWKSLGLWLLALFGFLIVQGVVESLLHAEVADFMKAMSGSRNVLLFLTLVILAPIIEEMIFRGYLFKAWRYSRIGLTGTLLVTSAIFVSAHWGQYDISRNIFLFLFSILLGLARERTGSLWGPLILHAANNTVPAVLIIFLKLS